MKSICTNRTQIEDWILEKVWYCDNVREGGREGEREEGRKDTEREDTGGRKREDTGGGRKVKMRSQLCSIDEFFNCNLLHIHAFPGWNRTIQ